MVTSYQDADQAWRNYASCVGNGMSGYSWRLVGVEVIEQAMLNDVVELLPEKDIVEAASKMLAGRWDRPADILIQDAPKSSGWGSGWLKPENRTSDNPILNAGISVGSQHGLTGSVWVINHSIPKKSRVPASELDKYLAMGYEKCGPKTLFRD